MPDNVKVVSQEAANAAIDLRNTIQKLDDDFRFWATPKDQRRVGFTVGYDEVHDYAVSADGIERSIGYKMPFSPAYEKFIGVRDAYTTKVTNSPKSWDAVRTQVLKVPTTDMPNKVKLALLNNLDKYLADISSKIKILDKTLQAAILVPPSQVKVLKA